MSQTTLTATPRTGSGTPTARRLRAEGHIPGVLYGRGMEPISVTVERREFRLALSGPAGANTVLACRSAAPATRPSSRRCSATRSGARSTTSTSSRST